MTDIPPDIFIRLATLERQMELLVQHTGLQLPPPEQLLSTTVSPDVVALMRSGNKIGAVKRQRELTGCDLREAMAVVESLGMD